jgi:hypothetical protein
LAVDTATHYALLVAINLYPGLSNLAGPENDAEAFAQWLTSTDGGGLDPTHVVVIKSNDFDPATDPYDANPTDTHIKKALNGWLKQDGRWRDRVGERLYLFFAGHGFTAGSLEDPALFTARAQLDDREYIAALHYARKIAVAGFFDEIILIMDCCQDVLRSTTITEPNWSPPDRQADARVRMMTAFGAPRGQKAFEEDPAAGQKVHGYFSRVFLDALRQADADAEGWVTARAVEARFEQLWAPTYLQMTGYEPPMNAPKHLRLYRRDPAAVPPPAAAAAPTPVAAARGGAHVLRESGLTRLTATVGVATADPGTALRFFKSDSGRVAHPSQAGARLHLPPGDYRARLRIGRSIAEHEIHVAAEPADSTLFGFMLQPTLPAMELTSAIPASWSTTRHEFHHYPAESLLAAAARQAPPADHGVLFVFARDSAHRPGAAWSMDESLRTGLRLRRLGAADCRPEDQPIEPHVDAGAGIVHCIAAVPDGVYLLGIERRLRERTLWDEMVVQVTAGWRTEIWLDTLDDTHHGSRFDLDTAAVRVARWDRPPELEAPWSRQTELLRDLLADSLREPNLASGAVPLPATLPDLESLGPMGVLLATTLATRAPQPDRLAIRTATDWLAQAWNADSADVIALQRWCKTHRAGNAARKPHRPLPAAVPMLKTSWSLLFAGPPAVHLSASAQREIGWWRTASDLWLTTQRPADDSFAETDQSLPLPTTPGGAPDLRALADALRRPVPGISPFQQSLRHVVLSAAEDDDEGEAQAAPLDAILSTQAQAAELDLPAVHMALQALWQVAAATQIAI